MIERTGYIELWNSTFPYMMNNFECVRTNDRSESAGGLGAFALQIRHLGPLGIPCVHLISPDHCFLFFMNGTVDASFRCNYTCLFGNDDRRTSLFVALITNMNVA